MCESKLRLKEKWEIGFEISKIIIAITALISGFNKAESYKKDRITADITKSCELNTELPPSIEESLKEYFSTGGARITPDMMKTSLNYYFSDLDIESSKSKSIYEKLKRNHYLLEKFSEMQRDKIEEEFYLNLREVKSRAMESCISKRLKY
jgi:hypothetical protein